jgi:SEC-C motif
MSETARKLVDEMVAAGEWPKPELLEAIADQGADAIEPLREVLRRDLHGWPEEAPLWSAIGLLGVLRAEQAVPDLLPLFRTHGSETLEEVGGVLGLFGEAAIEPALAVARDATLRWYSRAVACGTAIRAAGENPALRERVAATLRELLAEHVARAPEFAQPEPAEVPEQNEAEWDDEEESAEEEWEELDEEGPEEDEEALAEDEGWDEAMSREPEVPPSAEENFFEMATSLVCDLAHLADPQARPVIQAAFDADIIDQWMIAPEDVEDNYRKGGWEERRFDPDNWLREYRENYEAHEEREREQARTQPLQYAPAPPAVAEDEYEPAPKLTPIENTGRKIGRNDPCWCGSGKKYKKCHLGKDQESGT